MRYRMLKRRILKIIESDDLTIKKYMKIRKFFMKQMDKLPDQTNKGRIISALPVLKKILQDEETPILFDKMAPGELNKTQDFILFLEKITR